MLTAPPPARRGPAPTAHAGHVAPPPRRAAPPRPSSPSSPPPTAWAPPAPRSSVPPSPRVPTPPPADRPQPGRHGRHAGGPDAPPPPGAQARPSGRHVRPDVAPEVVPGAAPDAAPGEPRTARPAAPAPTDTRRRASRATGTAPGLPVALPADVEAPAPSRPARRSTPPRRGRSLTLGLGAAVAGALVAGTMVTVDTLDTGTADPLASADRLLQQIPGGTEPVESVGPAAAPEAPRVDLATAVSAAEEAGERSGATVGVAAVDIATGELAPGSGGEETFDTASLAKLFVVVDMLQRQRDGEMTLNQRDLRLVHAALTVSSDPAMNALWTQYDGPGAITRVARALDLDDTSAPEDTSQWGEVQTSARDMVKLLRHVQVDLPAQDRDLVLGAMGQAPRTAGDGFDQGYGFLDGGTPVKQGWMCCIASRAEVHSVAIIDGRYMVAVMSSQPPGYDQARQIVSAAAGAVRDHLRPVSSAG
ncbi:serine hydrolase [Actinomycetospora rhizophila]|uniref:Serine hydrolase n=1 Tax=Actinomycetospora rhizophila TaxID=1416876 RepID=A0ABV9ZA18_9PSEU